MKDKNCDNYFKREKVKYEKLMDQKKMKKKK